MVVSRKTPNHFVAIVAVRDKNKATVVVELEIRPDVKTGALVVDFATDAYGKTKRKNDTVPSYEWFTEQFNNNTLLYLNKEKSTSWFSGTGSEAAVDRKLMDALSDYIMSDKIQYVKTEEDLAKAKAEHPTMYQRQQSDQDNIIITEGTTEAIQQFPEEWAELWALNPDKSWKELREMAAKKFPDTLQNTLYAGLICGVLGAGSRGIHIALDRNIDLALRKELHDETITAIENRINHIKQSGISPDYAGETINANLNNATVLIDGDTLNTYAQCVGEEKAAEKLGVTVDDIREAAKKGDTVEVNQGNFEALAASDPSFYQEVRDALSFDVNDISNQKYNQIQANIERYSKLGEKQRMELKTEVDKIVKTMEGAGAPKGQVEGMKAMLTSFATANVVCICRQ